MPNRQVILITDDSEMNRTILKEMLGDEYEILEAENGREAVEILQKNAEIDLLMLDIVMPEMDGFQVLEIMNRRRWIEDVPVIMISSESAPAYMERAYSMGIVDFISRPFDMRIVHRRVVNTLMLYAKQKRLISLVANQVYEREKNNSLMINILSNIVEFRNGESGLHVLHIHTVTDLLLRRLVQKTDRYGLSDDDITIISIASALHDIGKISIPESILNKPGSLTPEEYEIMKSHTTSGAALLKDMPLQQNEPLLLAAEDICRWHHERYDGRGYPDGLSGEAIPISAQAVSMADVYDALTSERCYKPAYDHESAIRMIMDGECGVFNPLLLECLVDVESRLREELHNNSDVRDYVEEATRHSEQLLREEEIESRPHAMHVLALEQARTRFYQEESQFIEFLYDSATGRVELSDWAVAHTNKPKICYLPDGESSLLLTGEDLASLTQRLQGSTPERPNVEMVVKINVDGQPRWHKLTARSIWAEDATRECLGAVGQAVDIHRNAIRDTASFDNAIYASRSEMYALMRNLRSLCTLVRLVDVQQARVLELDSGGDLRTLDIPCFALWGRTSRCENCVGARAFETEQQTTKIEFMGNMPCHVVAKYVDLDGSPCVVEMVHQIQDEALKSTSGSVNLYQRLQEYSRALYRDTLTGAYNRNYYEEQMRHLEMAVAVAMIDVDNFKSINDQLGHPVGDETLRVISQTILGCIRSTDVLIRYGGDEFLLLFPQIPEGVFFEKLDEIRRAVRQIQLESLEGRRLSVSVGGVYDVHPLAEAVRRSDILMYKEKAAHNQLRKDSTQNANPPRALSERTDPA